MEETDFILREASTLAGISTNSRFDWDKGIVYDVALLGKKSKNGFIYSDQAIDDAYKLVESAGSYIDHSTDPNDNSRKLRENFGRAVQPYKNSAGELCAKEYHFNVKHAGAEDFKWACLNIPHRIGFSIIADGRGKTQSNGIRLVERILKVDSFDVVDQPATTSGIWNLKESVQIARNGFVGSSRKLTFVEPDFSENGYKQVFTVNFNGSEITSIDKYFLQEQKNMTIVAPPAIPVITAPNPHAEIDVKLREQTDKLTFALAQASKSEHEYIRLLAKTVDEYQLKEAEEKKRVERDKTLALREAKAKEVLKDDTYITPTFKNQLANAKDDAEVQALIDDRAKFALREQNSGVTSTGQDNSGNGSGGTKELVNKYFG